MIFSWLTFAIKSTFMQFRLSVGALNFRVANTDEDNNYYNG